MSHQASDDHDILQLLSYACKDFDDAVLYIHNQQTQSTPGMDIVCHPILSAFGVVLTCYLLRC